MLGDRVQDQELAPCAKPKDLLLSEFRPIAADLCAAASSYLRYTGRQINVAVTPARGPHAVHPKQATLTTPDVGPSNAVPPTRQNLCAEVAKMIRELMTLEPTGGDATLGTGLARVRRNLRRWPRQGAIIDLSSFGGCAAYHAPHPGGGFLDGAVRWSPPERLASSPERKGKSDPGLAAQPQQVGAHASGRIALPDRALWYIGQAPCGVAWYTATECVGLVYWYTPDPAAPCRHDYSADRQSAATHGTGVATAGGYAQAVDRLPQQGIPPAPSRTS
jgi:hypothetical protein